MPVSTPSSTRPARVLTGAEIRRAFIDYFVQRRGHAFVPSSPVVPHDDPTLLFTNAGMNQFKPIFLGQESRPYTRAVNTQKCIRAGGKHNDLEDVGKDTYHHTFFEMLGNWSFGDYFKAEAIEWSWDLLTNVYGIAPDRLYATYFEGDKKVGLEPDFETRDLWLRHLPAERVIPGNMKDNFWEMGETGPCGPCTEIHYDRIGGRNAAKLVNAGDPNVLEIWNNVFIQFNRNPDRSLVPLPAKHVDTGMGFERLASVLQHKMSNYDTDIWSPIFRAIQEKTGARAYSGGSGSLEDHIDIAYRVIADHVRCLTIAITDGAGFGAKGRDSVLRSIARRASRHAHQTLRIKVPVLYQLVPAVVDSLGDAFPELRKNPKHVAQVIREEEEAFLRTLDRGLLHFDEEVYHALAGAIDAKLGGGWKFCRGSGDEGYLPSSITVRTDKEERVFNLHPMQNGEIDITSLGGEFRFNQRVRLDAEAAFLLHDTYGFPIDLTRVMAEERGMTVDVEGYERLMEEARQRSRGYVLDAEAGTFVLAGGKAAFEINSTSTLPPEALDKLRKLGVEPTRDQEKYHSHPLSARVKAIWNGRNFDESVSESSSRIVAVILDQTCFYAEQGGQVGDAGVLFEDSSEQPASFGVSDTQTVGGYMLHIGRCSRGELNVGDEVLCEVESSRREPVLANHTGTHLLNHALRAVLGDDVNQKGSLVAPDRLRFDFSHTQAMTAGEIERVEKLVNDAIARAMNVYAEVVPLAKAKAIHGVRAIFGERYPDPVRVVSIGVPVADLVKEPSNPKWYDYSIEFCGGTHLEKTDEARRFVIQHEQALAAGVRRVIALTGPAALAAEQAAAELEQRVREAASGPDETLLSEFNEIVKHVDELPIGALAKHHITAAIDGLRERVKKLRKATESANRGSIVDQARALADKVASGGSMPLLIERLDGADRDGLLAAMDVLRAKLPDTACMLLSVDGEQSKITIVAAVPKNLIANGLKAGDWVKAAATACGGSGGGKPDMAQAGGKDPAKINDAIAAARGFAQKALT